MILMDLLTEKELGSIVKTKKDLVVLLSIEVNHLTVSQLSEIGDSGILGQKASSAGVLSLLEERVSKESNKKPKIHKSTTQL